MSNAINNYPTNYTHFNSREEARKAFEKMTANDPYKNFNKKDSTNSTDNDWKIAVEILVSTAISLVKNFKNTLTILSLFKSRSSNGLRL